MAFYDKRKLDNKMIEYLDIIDENGNLTGERIDRNIAHAKGIRHRAVHLWLVRKKNDHIQILLQKRSHNKGSFPDCYDISSAGHVSAGEDFETTAIRELKEELGIDAKQNELIHINDKDIIYDGNFHNSPFHDRELARVFIMWKDLEESEFKVDLNEVSSVRWIDLEECIQCVTKNTFQHCLYIEGLYLLKDTLSGKLSNPVIRTAQMSDLDIISKVEAECFPAAEAATKAEFEKRLQSYANHFWLLFEDDQLISFVDGFVTNEMDLSDEMYENADMHDENGDWQMLFGVNTIPTHRKKGYASKLIQRAISDAKKQGRKGLVLTCKEPLISYYSKFGFQNEGISKSVHGNVIWYQMRIQF